MKKFFMAAFAVAAIAISFYSFQSNNLNGIDLENIQTMAMAQWEGGLNEFDCTCYSCETEYGQQGVVFYTYYSPGGNCTPPWTMCSYGYC
ncbi:MAG: hypothetical protein JEZ14_22525 [Marinilabiliaceae bacterium]|nr:hypothetical protein [Marinilabiliaceae bacterium]